jgi:hypothetical protein
VIPLQTYNFFIYALNLTRIKKKYKNDHMFYFILNLKVDVQIVYMHFAGYLRHKTPRVTWNGYICILLIMVENRYIDNAGQVCFQHFLTQSILYKLSHQKTTQIHIGIMKTCQIMF